MRWKLSHQKLTWHKENYIPWILQCIACMACAWVFAQGLWWLAAPISTTTPVNTNSTLAEQNRHVVVRHFFEIAHASSTIDEAGETPPSQSDDAKWRLIATYVDSDDRSRAVLALEDGSRVVVAKVGGLLPSGHEVGDVQRDRVILSKNTQRSELTLRPDGSSSQDQDPPALIKESR